MTWDALRKSLNGLVNKVNIMNIKQILPEFFGEVRGPKLCLVTFSRFALFISCPGCRLSQKRPASARHL